jgi:high affinity Mn2+ porin
VPPRTQFLVALLLCASAVQAADEDFSFHSQATYVGQNKRGLNSPYAAQNSLSPTPEFSHSFTGTLYLGAKTWQGGEIYLNPEVALGRPLSNLTGLGGFTNGEIARTSGPNPTIYRARLFTRQSWGLGGGTEQLDGEANQLAMAVDVRRLVLTVGNLSITDVFDDNAYSHEPRRQFLNWTLMTYGAWDFPADARGYSWGAALEYIAPDWAIRAGRFIMPRLSNQLQLNYSFANAYGDALEWEHGWTLDERKGRVRLLAYRNRAMMGSYDDALAMAGTGIPDLRLTRQWRTRHGYGINLEQALSGSIGAFARWSWNNGRTETFAFTEVDRSLSAGLLLTGAAWGRADDNIGLGLVKNALSQPHRDYLAAGGMGYFLGDGRLSYRPENILEAFYSLNLDKRYWVSLDYQRIANPAYNADRGPVDVWAVRWHAEF